MKFSKAELAGICLTLGLLLFFAGWFCRGAAGGDGYTVSGEHPPELQSSPTPQVFVPDERVDLNTATLEELMTLPGIGRTKAQDILDYRRDHGAFAWPEEITNVPGIGRGTYEELAAYVTASAP